MWCWPCTSPSRAAVVMVWARLSNRTATHRTLRGRNVSRVLLFMILAVPCSDGTNLQPVDVPCCHETCMSCRCWTIPVMLSWNYFYSLNPLLQIDCKSLSKNWKSTLQYFLIIKSFMYKQLTRTPMKLTLNQSEINEIGFFVHNLLYFLSQTSESTKMFHLFTQIWRHCPSCRPQ